jgi:hypothetical protein
MSKPTPPEYEVVLDAVAMLAEDLLISAKTTNTVPGLAERTTFCRDYYSVVSDGSLGAKVVTPRPEFSLSVQEAVFGALLLEVGQPPIEWEWGSAASSGSGWSNTWFAHRRVLLCAILGLDPNEYVIRVPAHNPLHVTSFLNWCERLKEANHGR